MSLVFGNVQIVICSPIVHFTFPCVFCTLSWECFVFIDRGLGGEEMEVQCLPLRNKISGPKVAIDIRWSLAGQTLCCFVLLMLGLIK